MRHSSITVAIGLAAVGLVGPLPAQAPARTGTLSLPANDPQLQRGLDRVLSERPFRRLVTQKRMSVALVDLSDPSTIRYAGRDDAKMRYAASLPKIAIMLGVFDRVDRGELEYSPLLRVRMEDMIRRSSNPESTRLIELVGFESIARALRDPRHQLYHPRRGGGLWVGRDYGGGPGLWKRDPLNNLSHGASARQVARFLVMMDRGQLVSPWASAEMKAIMGHPDLHHKFVLGLEQRPSSRIFRKSGTWKQWHADAAIVERNGKKYVAVALVESVTARGVLSDLIVRLDDLIHVPGRPVPGVPTAALASPAGETAGTE